MGDLRIGASALFARTENGRIVLLRTPPIDFVEPRTSQTSAPRRSRASIPSARDERASAPVDALDDLESTGEVTVRLPLHSPESPASSPEERRRDKVRPSRRPR